MAIIQCQLRLTFETGAEAANPGQSAQEYSVLRIASNNKGRDIELRTEDQKNDPASLAAEIPAQVQTFCESTGLFLRGES
jgi:hypothetical protein